MFEDFSKICRENSSIISLTRITGTLREDLCTFMVVSRCIPVRMRNVSDKFVEEVKTNFMFNNLFPKIVPFMR